MGFLNEVAKGFGTMARKADERQQVNDEQARAAALKAEVEKDHAVFLRQAPEEYEARKEEREISRRFTLVFSQGGWRIDFRPFDSLDTKYRPKLIEILSGELYKTYRDAGRHYLAAEKDSTSTPLIFFHTLGSYLHFPEFAELLNRSLAHQDFYFSGDSIGSILTGFKEPGVLAARTPEGIRALVFCEGDISTDKETSPFAASSLQLVQLSKLIHWYPKRSKYESLIQLLAKAMNEELSPSAEELINSEDPSDWIDGVNIVLGSDKEEDLEYRCLKMALIKAAIEPIDQETFAKVYEFIRDAAICLLSTISIVGEGDDERIVRVPPVDILVADAIIYKRTNNLSQMDGELKETSAKIETDYFKNDSLLIGDRCGAHTFPDIQNASRTAVVEHEATTSKISEDQLFYCNQRGIGPEEAVGLIVNGYAREVLSKLPMEFAVEARKLLQVSLEGSVG